MRAVISAVLAVLFLVAPVTARAEGVFGRLDAAATRLSGDYRAFYLDNGTHLRLALALAAGGTLANTGADSEVRVFFQDNIRSSATDGLSDITRLPGEALITVPALALFYLSTDNLWAERSLRALFVGGPLGLFLRSATGGDGRELRLEDVFKQRSERPLFIGPPFITAAKMEARPSVRYFSTGPDASGALQNKRRRALFSQAALVVSRVLERLCVEKAARLFGLSYKDGAFIVRAGFRGGGPGKVYLLTNLNFSYLTHDRNPARLRAALFFFGLKKN